MVIDGEVGTLCWLCLVCCLGFDFVGEIVFEVHLSLMPFVCSFLLSSAMISNLLLVSFTFSAFVEIMEGYIFYVVFF